MRGTITLELCEEDRSRLDTLIALAREVLSGTAELHTAEDEAPVADGIPVEAVVPTEPEKPKATKADVQAMVQKLATPTSGKRDAVKRIVNDYAVRVSDIPEDKLDEVMQKLTALAGDQA